ncbi:reverse transcriptase [Cucumis melo var. makuwa]|uniref:Reverse transcriptase n=1 Tax=Cucumis melo var. makuwa TaxID=1194695 RepID=A0A5D3CBV4_CUCMM|nr:reverse transcriptase [Cucumis melo var. makuwa]
MCLEQSVGVFKGEKLNGQNYFSWSHSIKMILKPDIASPEDMGEKGNVDEIKRGSVHEVVAKTEIDETKQDHSSNLHEYDLSLDIPVALRKSIKSYTKHSICNYVSHKNLSPQFRDFTAGLNLPLYLIIFILP